jgi:hypothetical protein
MHIVAVAVVNPLTHELNWADCGYPVHGTERKISHLLYMDGLQLLRRSLGRFGELNENCKSS